MRMNAMSVQLKMRWLSIPTICFMLLVGGFVFSLERPALAHDGPYKGEWTLPAGYPDGFDGYGNLTRIDSNVVVINDSSHRLASNVTFHVEGLFFPTMKDLHPGDLVGFMLSADKKTVVSLWVIPAPAR